MADTEPPPVLLDEQQPALALSVAGDGPLVVMLHGIGGNRRNWPAQVAALAGDYLAVAWDMRGYGDSADYDGPMRMDDLCADIERIRHHFQRPALHLVGLSMGGMIALEYHRRHPHRVASLVLANTNAGFAVDFDDAQKEEFVRLRRDPILNAASMEELAAVMAGVLMSASASPGAAAAIKESILLLRPDSYLKALDLIVHIDARDTLAAIDKPVLVISSDDDRVIPAASSRSLAEAITGSSFELIAAAGHLSNLEQAPAFNALLGAFLADVRNH